MPLEFKKANYKIAANTQQFLWNQQLKFQVNKCLPNDEFQNPKSNMPVSKIMVVRKRYKLQGQHHATQN